jgi:hypothetical protein
MVRLLRRCAPGNDVGGALGLKLDLQDKECERLRNCLMNRGKDVAAAGKSYSDSQRYSQ